MFQVELPISKWRRLRWRRSQWKTKKLATEKDIWYAERMKEWLKSHKRVYFEDTISKSWHEAKLIYRRLLACPDYVFAAHLSPNLLSLEYCSRHEKAKDFKVLERLLAVCESGNESDEMKAVLHGDRWKFERFIRRYMGTKVTKILNAKQSAKFVH